MKKVIILILSCLFLSCHGQENGSQHPITGYAFDKPAEVYKLPDILEEISGLSYLGEDNVATVQDEKGLLFIYNLKEKKITNKIDFGKEGDYEGITVIKNDAWILESNGTLYQIKNYLSDDFSVDKIETDLEKDYDAEGLCYDSQKGLILIACKEAIDKDEKEIKTVFGFDPEKKEILKEPIFTIDVTAIKDKLMTDTFTKTAYDIQKSLKNEKLKDLFMPSAIAISPINKHYYLLSSQNKLMVVIDDNSNVLECIGFSEPLMQQPEGITFSSDGTLYISNEGKSGKPNILKYNYKNP